MIENNHSRLLVRIYMLQNPSLNYPLIEIMLRSSDEGGVKCHHQSLILYEDVQVALGCMKSRAGFLTASCRR